MMDPSKWKIVLDPVHGVIELDPLAVQIIDTREFQRLRFVKQLGCTDYVYSGATHTRFSHSIGVYYLASKMIESLKRWTPDDLNIKMDDWEEQCIRIAALCHDLGHGPFSHIYEELCQERNGQDGRWKHQDISCIMVKRIFKTNPKIRDALIKGIESIRLIMRLIRGKKIKDMNEDEKKKAYIYQIVSNKENYIDVDKWDYLCRDAMYCGMNERFLSERAIAGARVVMTSMSGEPLVHQIGYPEKDALMFYTMFQTRYNLHRYIYQHRVIAGVNLMLKDIFQASESESKMETPVTNPKALIFNFELYPIGKTSKIKDDNKELDKFIDSKNSREEETKEEIQTDKYLRLTDDIISRIRYVSEQNGYSMDRPIAKAQKILKWIDKRDFYRLHREFHLKLISFNYGMKDKNPMKKLIFYNKRSHLSGAVQGNTLPRSKVSHLLGNVFSEYYIRIYVKTPDEEEDTENIRPNGRIDVKTYDIPENLKQIVEDMAVKYDTGSTQDDDDEDDEDNDEDVARGGDLASSDNPTGQ